MTIGADSLKRHVASSIAWASATRILGQILNWAMTVVVIRFLSPADYGLMALVTALTGFLQAMTSTGFADALVQAREVNEALWRRTFGLILVISAGLTGSLCLAAYPLAELYGQPRLVALLQVSSLSFLVLAPSAVSRARLDRELAFKYTSRIDMLANVTAGLVVLGLAWLGCGVWSLMAGMLTGMTITSAALWRLAPFRQWPSLSLAGMGPILHFGAYRTAEHVLWYISTQVDVFIVGKLLGERSLGVYAVSRTVAALPVNKLSMILRPISSSAFARLQDDRAQALAYLLATMRMLAFLCFPVFFGMAAVAPELVAVVLGARWTEAVMPLTIMALGMAARPSGLVLAPFLAALGEVRASFVNTLSSLVLFTAAYAVGSQWGLLGVCVAGALVYPVQFVFLVRRIAGITGARARDILASLSRPLLCALLMFLVVMAFRTALGEALPASARLALLIAAGALTYAAAALALCRGIVVGALAQARALRGHKT